MSILHASWTAPHTYAKQVSLVTSFVQRHSMTTGLRCLLGDRRVVLLELQHLKILIVLAAETVALKEYYWWKKCSVLRGERFAFASSLVPFSCSDYENTVASVFWGIIEEKEAPLHLDFSICHVIHSIAFESVENPPQQNSVWVYLEEMLYVDVYISDPAFYPFLWSFFFALSNGKMASEILCKNRSWKCFWKAYEERQFSDKLKQASLFLLHIQLNLNKKSYYLCYKCK